MQQKQHSCLRCQDSINTILMLECEHIFCITCIAFMHIKYQPQLKDQTRLRCIFCNKLSDIGQEQLDLINQNLTTVVLPYLTKDQAMHTQAYTPETEPKLAAKQNNLLASKEYSLLTSKESKGVKQHYLLNSKQNNLGISLQNSLSLQHSLQRQVQSQKRGQSPPRYVTHCSIHTTDQLSFVCFTCHSAMLCLKCVTSKKHQNHQIKSLIKSIDFFKDQASMHVLQVKESIKEIAMWGRRLEDKKKLIQQKMNSTVMEVNSMVESIVNSIEDKKNQIVQHLEKMYQEECVRIDAEKQILNEKTENLMYFQQALIKVPCEAISQIKAYITIFKEISATNYQFKEEIFNKIPFQFNFIGKKLNKLQQTINDITIYQLKTQNKNIVNCKSQEQKLPIKNGQNFNREHKKYTKTEQDQRKIKGRVNYKTQTAKIKKEFPQYILQFLQKPAVRQLQFSQANTLQNSIKSKGLYKTQLSYIQQLKKKRKKKQNSKQRVQRKTVTKDMKKKRTQF